jgi:uncharacterized membrane protein required for colicin V production
VDLPVNTVDLVIAGVAIIAAVIGWRSGALPQVLGLAGAAAGVALVILAVPTAAEALDRFSLPVRAFLAFGGAFLIVTVAEAIGSTLGGSLRGRLGRGVASRLDDRVEERFRAAHTVCRCATAT